MDRPAEFVYTGHENLLAMKHARNYNRFLDELIKSTGRGANLVVDFGAGVGALAEGARKWAPRLVCLEPDPRQVQILRAAGFEVATDLADFADSSVDYFYSVNVMEHIDGDQDVMAAIFRKLKPGGHLLVYVPALQWLYTSMDEAVGHIRRYHRADLTNKLRAAGFTLERCEYVDSAGVAATLAYKWFGSKNGSIDVRALKLYDRVAFPISRALDLLARRWLGKNLLAICVKP